MKINDPIEKVGKGLVYAGGAYVAYKVGMVALGMVVSTALTFGVAAAAVVGGGWYLYRRIAPDTRLRRRM